MKGVFENAGLGDFVKNNISERKRTKVEQTSLTKKEDLDQLQTKSYIDTNHQYGSLGPVTSKPSDIFLKEAADNIAPNNQHGS